MKLYFKNKNIETIIKWINFISPKCLMFENEYHLFSLENDLKNGYIDMVVTEQMEKDIKALNIWKEPINKEKIEKIEENCYIEFTNTVQKKINEIIERVNQIVEITDLNLLKRENEN